MDINMSNVLNFDVRTSMSSEVKVKEYNIEGDTYRKYRISFTDPNKLFKVDRDNITDGRGEWAWGLKNSHLRAACKAKFDFSPF